MSDIQKGETFADGQIVNAARLNNLADLATILAGFIADKAVIAPLATDYVVVLQASSTTLKKALFQGGVNSVGLAMPPEFSVSIPNPITASGTFTVSKVQQDSNKVYAAPADGSLGPPTFRLRSPKDQAMPTITIPANIIDWNTGTQFFKLIATNTVLSFSNAADGMMIRVVLTQSGGGGHTVTWPPGMLWAGAVDPVLGTANGSSDLYFIMQVATTIIGVAHQHLG